MPNRAEDHFVFKCRDPEAKDGEIDGLADSFELEMNPFSPW
jgi:hypothetical protein